jgi:Ca2+-binding EF-hand superfamily protein
MDEAELIMKRYDNNSDARLNFSEFSSVFNPMDRITSDILNARRANVGHFHRSEIFAGVTKDLFTSVLRQHINVETYSERIRQRLAGRPFFRQSEAFMALDNRNSNFITKEEFGNLLAHHRFFATDIELSTLVDRFDKNKDGRVSYSEFVQEITPHSPSKY